MLAKVVACFLSNCLTNSIQVSLYIVSVINSVTLREREVSVSRVLLCLLRVQVALVYKL
jgi:hypothetical protein